VFSDLINIEVANTAYQFLWMLPPNSSLESVPQTRGEKNYVRFLPCEVLGVARIGSILDKLSRRSSRPKKLMTKVLPYLVPFLQSDLRGTLPLYTRRRRTLTGGSASRLMAIEIQHRLHQFDNFKFLLLLIWRFLVDEHFLAASVTLVPELSVGDFVRLLETPT
jgi:hypothetical protein